MINIPWLEAKKQEWLGEIKVLMGEVAAMKSTLREKQSRISFLTGAIAGYNDQIQEMQLQEAKRNEELHKKPEEAVGNGEDKPANA